MHKRLVGPEWIKIYGYVADLEERIGYCFRDDRIREQAFTHRSHRHENPAKPDFDNERLEFLGDSILGFFISRMLFERFTDRREGELSRMRSHLVSAHHLAGKAKALDLGRELLLGRGEERSGGRLKDSILADAYESLLASVFLDGGLEEAEKFVEREFRSEVETLVDVAPLRDYKSHLQEGLHVQGESEPQYRVMEEQGPDHHKVFLVAVWVGGKEISQGTGKSKKTAQQAAARDAIQALGL